MEIRLYNHYGEGTTHEKFGGVATTWVALVNTLYVTSVTFTPYMQNIQSFVPSKLLKQFNQTLHSNKYDQIGLLFVYRSSQNVLYKANITDGRHLENDEKLLYLNNQ